MSTLATLPRFYKGSDIRFPIKLYTLDVDGVTKIYYDFTTYENVICRVVTTLSGVIAKSSILTITDYLELVLTDSETLTLTIPSQVTKLMDTGTAYLGINLIQEDLTDPNLPDSEFNFVNEMPTDPIFILEDGVTEVGQES